MSESRSAEGFIPELWKELKFTLYERTSSPLAGAFIFAWLLFNFKLVLIAFGDAKLAEKLALFDAYFYANACHLTDPASTGWLAAIGAVFTHALDCHLSLAPGIAAIAMLMLYPFPAMGVYWWWHQQQNALKGIRKSLDDKAPITREEEKRLRQKLSQIEEAHDAALTKAKDQIEALRTQVQSLQSLEQESSVYRHPKAEDEELASYLAEEGDRATDALKQATAELNALKKQLDQLQSEKAKPKVPDWLTSPEMNELLKRIVASSGRLIVDPLPKIGKSTVFTQYLIDKLQQADYISAPRWEESDLVIRFTPKGNELAVDLAIAT